MSDQIKVLSRDVLKNLIDGWGIFKACLTYRKTRPGYEREFYEIDKQVVDKFDLLIITLMDEHEELEPKWEPGILAIFKDGRTVVRLEREIEPDLSTWWVTDMQDGTEYEQGLGFGGWRVHRLPDEFKKGDWFATENNLLRRVAENCGDGSIVDEVGSKRLTSEIRHVPPPKGENPKKRAWDLGAVGGQSSDVEPQRKKPEPNKQVPEETISSPSHQQWLRERKKQDSLNPQPVEEPEPKWEPGTVAATSYGYFRLDSKDGHYWHGVYIVTFPCSPIPRGDERLESEKSFQGIYRLPHEFKVGDWFATKNNLVRRVAENCGDGSIVDEVGSKRLTSEIRHVPPPPKGENPKKRAWDLGAVGGQSSDVEPQRKKPAPKCAGYPICDGNLVGLEHDEGCPLYKPKEPAPKWEPGMLAIFKDARTVVRLEREIEPGLRQFQHLPTWWVTDMQDRTEYEQGLGFGGWRVHRLPHEFKKGDWFECESEGIFQCFRMPQAGVIEATNGNLYKSEFCRHVPPPKEVMPNDDDRTTRPVSTPTGAVTGASPSGVNETGILDAPCVFCGYNGERYWQPESHSSACPWAHIAGFENRSEKLKEMVSEYFQAVRRAVETSEKPSQERHKCDACGKEFDPDDLQILCAKCAKMQIESILDCALHSELPTDRAVETSEKSHPQEKTNTKKWEDWKVYFNEYKELIVRADSMLSLLEHRGYIKHELISCPESVEVQQLIGDLRNAAARAVETSEKPHPQSARELAEMVENKIASPVNTQNVHLTWDQALSLRAKARQLLETTDERQTGRVGRD